MFSLQERKVGISTFRRFIWCWCWDGLYIYITFHQYGNYSLSFIALLSIDLVASFKMHLKYTSIFFCFFFAMSYLATVILCFSLTCFQTPNFPTISSKMPELFLFSVTCVGKGHPLNYSKSLSWCSHFN